MTEEAYHNHCINEIRETVSTKDRVGGRLYLDGYISSKGELSNLVVQLLGREGYTDILEETLAAVENPKVLAAVDYSSYDVTEAQWLQAKEEQITSWRESFARNSGQLEKQKPNYKEKLTYVDGAGYYIKNPDDGTTVVMHLRVVSKEVLSEQEPNLSKTPLDSKNPIVRAKELFRRSTPMARYIGRLNLSPDKLTSIR